MLLFSYVLHLNEFLDFFLFPNIFRFFFHCFFKKLHFYTQQYVDAKREKERVCVCVKAEREKSEC